MKGKNPALHEQTVTGKVINVGRDKKDEAIVFEIPMGSLKIVAIVNIPADDEESAPVYLKWRLATGPSGPRNPHRRVEPSESEGEGSDGDT